MSHHLPHAVVILALAAGLAACGDSHSPSPTAPTAARVTPIDAVPAPPVVGGQFINGTVSDTALRRLAGARVEFLDGPQAGVSVTTDAMGHFQLFGMIDDTTRFRASKNGYLTADATILPRCDG